MTNRINFIVNVPTMDWLRSGWRVTSIAIALGLMQLSSRWVPAVHDFNNVHSLFVARLMGLSDEQALTWNPAVGKAIADGIRRDAG